MFYFSSQTNVTSMCGVHCTPKLHKLSKASKVTTVNCQIK